jgi:hypothetical protein
MKIEISQHILEKLSKIKCHENIFVGSLALPCEQTEGRTAYIRTYMVKQIVAFRNNVNASENSYNLAPNVSSQWLPPFFWKYRT